ncbi:MAG: murein L,D-transpeptidase [Verrucomicrobiales bacterium]|nr:murein L,D-transpeptidase [Verrucomicrobiales bacterium]
MKFRFPVSLLAVLLCFFPQIPDAQDKNDKSWFAGGASDIDSGDGRRANKAIAKWTAKNGKQGDILLSGSPYYWDASKPGRPVFIRIIKNENRKGHLEVWLENPATKKFEHLKTYRIARFSGRLGPKTREGDFQAPEGFYYISRKGLNPVSNYHLSMNIGYPNAYDRAKGYTGSFIMIHGSSVSIGCYAMTDNSIEQIYTLVDRALAKGQKFVRVHCFPFEMSEENLEKHSDSKHYQFWKNLQEGWDWFEENKRPPNVSVSGGKYVFSKD